MRFRQLAVALVAAVPVAAVAGSGLRDGRPDWISGEALEWPRHKYVTGVGVADDRPTAEDRARAEISRVFTTRVVATTSAYAAETGRTTAGITTTAQERSVSDDTRSSTEKDLVGVEIAAVWQDPATRQIYALAALDRRQAAARVQAKLDALDAELRPLARDVAGPDRVGAGVAALRYRALARQREPLVADLAVVLPGERGAASTTAQDQAASAALSRLIVGCRVNGDPTRMVQDGVMRGLAAGGLRATDDCESPTDILVTVDATVEDLGQRDGWFWTRASASLAVRETGSGRTLVQIGETERQATTVAAEGRARALRALAGKLEKRLPGELASVPPR
jgi:hypothetical protein